jgi:hypothetical protein
MKKTYIMLAVLLLVAGMSYAANESFSAGRDNPWSNIPLNTHSYTKDYVLGPFRVGGGGVSVATDSTKQWADPIYFILPEAGELMKAWVIAMDSSAAVDTVGSAGYVKATIWSNAGTAADTAAYWTPSTGGRRLQPAAAESLWFTTTITKRQWDKGEVGKIQFDTVAAPTNQPRVAMWLLFRPKSTPATTDCYTR